MNEKSVVMKEIGESFVTFTHKSGLRVILSQKDFHVSYANLCVGFGSLLERAEVNGTAFSVPDGTAHFLEHKMFENEDGEDTFYKFSEFGADANAYTGTDRTCYLFATPENEHESLEVLLASVFSPFFTDRNVKKEKGIIIQELKMYRDDPYDSVSKAIMRNMYAESRQGRDICGSVGSVKSISAEDLCRAYDTFYRPDNMILSLCGKFDLQRVSEILDRTVTVRKDQSALCASEYFREKSPFCKKTGATVKAPITTPSVTIGIKCDPAVGSSSEKLRTYDEMSILAHALFSEDGPLVSSLRQDNLITESSYDVIHTEYCSHVLFSAETYDPKTVFSRFKSERAKLLSEGIPQITFERCKKDLYSQHLDAFNSSEGIAQTLLDDAFDGIDTSDVCKVLSELRIESANELAAKYLDQGRICLQAALPRRSNETKGR